MYQFEVFDGRQFVGMPHFDGARFDNDGTITVTVKVRNEECPAWRLVEDARESGDAVRVRLVVPDHEMTVRVTSVAPKYSKSFTCVREE